MSKLKYDTQERGLCAIICNFAHEYMTRTDGIATLCGYAKDVSNIQELFSDIKKFDFEVQEPYYNKSKIEFMTTLKELRKKLQSQKENEKYDKFVLFVLSHGGEDGILMYMKNDDKSQFVTEEEIIDNFSLDVVPALRGMPKCFFFQACRGDQETRAAGPPRTTNQPAISTYHMPIVTRANILVAHATLNHKRAYVGTNKGSFFIRNLIAVMKDPCQGQDIYTILTEVTRKASEDKTEQYLKCNQDGIKIEIDGEEIVLVGQWRKAVIKPETKSKESSHFLLSLSENEEDYVIQHKVSDYEFQGKISFKENDKLLPWPKENTLVSADQLTIFSHEDFKIEGKLESKLNPQYKLQGIIQIQGEKVFVDGTEPTHGVHIGDLDIMVKGNDRKHIDPTEFNEKTACIYICGQKHGEGTFTKIRKMWCVKTMVYQLSVFASTLTKHLHLTKPEWKKERLNQDVSVQTTPESNERSKTERQLIPESNDQSETERQPIPESNDQTKTDKEILEKGGLSRDELAPPSAKHYGQTATDEETPVAVKKEEAKSKLTLQDTQAEPVQFSGIKPGKK